LIAPGALTRRRVLSGCACGACASLIARPAHAAAGLEALFPQYSAVIAASMESGMDTYEANIEQRKQALFATLDAGAKDVLELGIGTGPNLKYYRPGTRVVGVEPNEYMDEYAREKAEALGLSLELRRGVGEALPLEDASVDVVVGTLVMCTVADPARVLAEVARVLRPGGQYLFIDHVAADPGTTLLFQQRLLDGLQQFVAGGCHLTRKTGELIESATKSAVPSSAKAGTVIAPLFDDVTIERFMVDDIWVIAPHVAGVATRVAA